MKRLFYSVAGGLMAGFALICVPVSAETVAVASVPFDFHIGKVALPPGEYSFAVGTGSTNMLVRKAGSEKPLIFVITGLEIHSRSSQASLVLQKVNGRHYLSHVWTGLSTAYRMPLTRAMREAEIAGARPELTFVPLQIARGGD